MRNVLEGRIEGRMAKGRKHRGMLKELKEGSFLILKRRAENRET